MASFKVILGPGKLSYPNVIKPQKNERGEDRYSTAFLIPPDYDLKPLKAALEKAMVEKFGANPATWPRTARKPDDVLVPAEEKYGQAFKGWHCVNASGKTKPGLVNAMLEKVDDASEVYPGRYAKISVAAFGYDNKTKGVTLGLNNIQLLKHDEPLAGKPRAEDEFSQIAEEMATTDDWN